MKTSEALETIIKLVELDDRVMAEGGKVLCDVLDDSHNCSEHIDCLKCPLAITKENLTEILDINAIKALELISQ